MANEAMDAALSRPLTAWPCDSSAALEAALDRYDPRPATATLRLDSTKPTLSGVLTAATRDLLRLTQELESLWTEALASDRRARRAQLGAYAPPLFDALHTDVETLLGVAPMEATVRLFHDLLSLCFPGQPLVLLMLTEAPSPSATAVEEAAVWWLSTHFPSPIWVVGEAAATMARLPQAALPPDPATPPTPARPGLPETPTTTAPAGRPHPNSEAEQRLEAALAGRGWAEGRVWNQAWSSDPTAKPYRPDLLWPEVKVVVEIDGPDHLNPIKYQDDRRRDRALQQAGCVVLRFTNDEVKADPAAAAWFIESIVTARRASLPRENQA